MSLKNPGIVFDASNSWNGFVHQGKVALFVAVKTICEKWDSAKTTSQNKEIFEQYFLELEHFEDFSIGRKIDENTNQYLSVHQVKNKENANLTSYDDALLGLVQHVVDDSGIERAYLHVTEDLKTSTTDLTKRILEINKKPKFIENALDLIAKNRNNPDFRKTLIEKTPGRRTELKQNLYFALKKLNLENEGLTEQNIDKAFDYYVDLLNKKMAEFKSADENLVKKIEIYSYPDGKNHCQVDVIRKHVIDIIKQYYETNPEHRRSYKRTSAEFHEKCYLYLCEQINKHIVERDLHYHDYTSGFKDRKISLDKIIDWLEDGKIDSSDEDYYLYHIRENIFNYTTKFCELCKKKMPCKIECEMEAFKHKLASMEKEELRVFTRFSNPQVGGEINIITYPLFVAVDVFTGHFSEGLRDIEKDFLSDKTATTYLDKENKECVLTSIRQGPNDEEGTCSEIIKNKSVYEMMMDCDYFISKDMDVPSIQDKSVSPTYAQSDADKAHIARCKEVRIISLENFLTKINGED